jgi:hypothetical protein
MAAYPTAKMSRATVRTMYPNGIAVEPVTASAVVTPPATTVSGAEAATTRKAIDRTPSLRLPPSCGVELLTDVFSFEH